MYPIAISRIAGSVGPWLGRIAGKDAAFLPALVTRLRAGGQFAGSKISDIVTWAKNSPSNAVLLATTVASLGYSMAELFMKESSDPEVAKFADDLTALAQKAAAKVDMAGATSQSLDVIRSGDDRVNDETAIDVLSWAKSHFGGIGQAVSAHRHMQAFFEMPLEDVRHGFNIYKLR